MPHFISFNYIICILLVALTHNTWEKVIFIGRLYSVEQKSQIILVTISRINRLLIYSLYWATSSRPRHSAMKLKYCILRLSYRNSLASLYYYYHEILVHWATTFLPRRTTHASSIAACCEGGRIKGLHKGYFWFLLFLAGVALAS